VVGPAREDLEVGVVVPCVARVGVPQVVRGPDDGVTVRRVGVEHLAQVGDRVLLPREVQVDDIPRVAVVTEPRRVVVRRQAGPCDVTVHEVAGDGVQSIDVRMSRGIAQDPGQRDPVARRGWVGVRPRGLGHGVLLPMELLPVRRDTVEDSVRGHTEQRAGPRPGVHRRVSSWVGSPGRDAERCR
jgi:hypothetical protein